MSHESLQGTGSQGSMALDLHLEYPVTLKVRDRRRNPLRRQQRVDEDERQAQQANNSRRSSHSCSPRLSIRRNLPAGGSAHQLPTNYYSSGHRRSSNASDCTHRTRIARKDCPHSRGRLERAISSDSRLTGAIPKCQHHHTPQSSMEQEGAETKSDTDIPHRHMSSLHVRR